MLFYYELNYEYVFVKILIDKFISIILRRLKLMWLTLVQPQSNCEIEFLPVYHPNEQEKKDPKLYAQNVRQLMAK